MLPANASPVALILAAGKGTRMRSRHPKAIQPLLGKPLTRHIIDLCRRIGMERIIVVVGHEAEQVRAALGEDVEYALQDEQRGTGPAVLAAAPLLRKHQGPLVVLQADNVLLTEEAVQSLIRRQVETGAAAVLLTALLPDALHYGRVLRSDSGGVVSTVEAKSATPEQLAVREINAGAYVFAAEALFRHLGAVQPDPVTGEVYLPGVIRFLVEAGQRVEAVVAEDTSAALSVNDRIELAEAAAVLRARILREHLRAGVTIEDLASTYIDADVQIGQDTVIRPQTYLSGSTVIGEECVIGPSAQITDCILGNGVFVQHAVLASSEVGDETKIGPFAQLRPGCKIGRKVKIGNFVELKAATVEDRVSIGHLAYIGDAFLGEKTNVGAGTITCNYDGKKKHKTHVGKGVFVGSHSTLVAPVRLEDGAFTAAGSVITEDVPQDGMGIGRSRQANKEGWARRYRELQEREG